MNKKNIANGADLEDEVFEESRIERGRKNRNPYISSMKEDRLYHIGLVAGPQNMKEMFGDVKVRFSMHFNINVELAFYYTIPINALN